MTQPAESNTQTIFLIACEFWADRGRTHEEMKTLMGLPGGMEKFIKPGFKIYKMLDEQFANL